MHQTKEVNRQRQVFVLSGECDKDKYKEKMEKTMTQTIYVMTHERAKTGDCGQQRSSVSPESGPGFEFSAGAGSGSRILDPDWVSDFGNH